MSKKLDFNKDNRGYSLIELIIVVAIITALMGVLMYSVNLVFGADAKGCAHSLVSSIADVKVNAMGREGAFLELKRDDNGDLWSTQYVKKFGSFKVDGEPRKIGDKRIKIYYFTGDVSAGSGTEFSFGAEPIYISFDRSTGSFLDSGSGEIGGASVSYAYYSGFEVLGGSKDYVITLDKLTGKTKITLN